MMDRIFNLYGVDRLWICLCVVIFTLNCQISAGYHELSATDHDICTSGASPNSTVDLVCRVQEQLSSRGASCTVTGIKWYRTNDVDVYEITSSAKYTIWESIDGWGWNGQQRVALLRVTNFDIRDIARYQCKVNCDYGNGLKGTVQYHSDVCLQEDNLNGLQCPVVLEQDSCTYNFQNGRCDRICDVRDHFYDGHDCATEVPVCAQEEFCAQKYADGVCHHQCSTPECQWDGGDCTNTALDLAPDSILIKVERPLSDYHLIDKPSLPTHRQESYRKLARYLSRVTHSLLRIVPEPRKAIADALDHAYSDSSPPRGYMDFHQAFDNVVLKLDNTNCEKRCFRKVDQVVQYLHLSNVVEGAAQVTNVNIHAITVLRSAPKLCKFTNTSMIPLEERPSSDSSDSLKTQQINADGSTEEPEEPDPGKLKIDTWIIVLCVIGTLIIVGLLIAIFAVMVSIRREQHSLNKDKEKNQRIYSSLQKGYNTCKPVDV